MPLSRHDDITHTTATIFTTQSQLTTTTRSKLTNWIIFRKPLAWINALKWNSQGIFDFSDFRASMVRQTCSRNVFRRTVTWWIM